MVENSLKWMMDKDGNTWVYYFIKIHISKILEIDSNSKYELKSLKLR